MQQQVAELMQLQAKSSDGVVELDATSFDRLVVGKKRPYSLIIFLAADHLQDKPALRLRELRDEFGHLAKAFRKNHANTTATGKLFFALVEYRRSGQLFHRLGVTSLPYIFRLASSFQIEADGTLKLRSEDAMKHSDYSAYPWTAEDMASFVQEKTGVIIGSIEKPSIFKSRIFPVVALAATAGLAYIAYNLYYAEFMKNTALWTFGTVAVFWFAVSGGMHNIIRGVPMYYVEQGGGRVQLFLPQGQGQLGAEGFIMGSLVTIFALSLATLSYLAPRVSNPTYRRAICYTALFLGGAAFFQVLRGYRWKTGYRWRTWF
ncbi:hypothetical protein WJX73_007543 [Symbiochloris irregularis]|uniref:Uncharacterized protein n=1 Tax=Symbiochloris irregularis TaxID=706552 RepID=A0AAW1P557_9CHLO